MSNLSPWVLERILLPAAVYVAIVYLIRPLILIHFRSRYSATRGMEAFLGRFRLKHRALSFDNELDTLAAIQKRHAHAWGMAALGMASLSHCWQPISKGQVPWIFLGTALAILYLHAWAMASSAFAAQCFRVLEISSLETHFQRAGKAPLA
jgi:hypothetical protein